MSARYREAAEPATLSDRRLPVRYEGLEACPCRIVCFSDCGETVEAVGDVAKAVLSRRS